MNAEMQVEFDFSCSECGQDLNATHTSNRRGTEYFTISPCKSCLEAAKEEAKKEVAEQ